jgi:thiol:disulfide interchange protein DsbD
MTLAQGNPVTFKVSRNQVSPTEIDVVFTGTIAAGWHVYSTDIGEDGPTPATLTTEKAEGAKAVGKLKAQGKEKNVMDEIFGMQVRYFENSVRFVQRYKITAPKYHIAGFLEYGACNDEMCMPPTAVEFEYKGENTPTNLLPEEGGVTPTSQKDSMGAKLGSLAETSIGDTALASTQSDSLASSLSSSEPSLQLEGDGGRLLWRIFLLGLLGGLIALFTPCVWPIIPMTVSFFLKRTKDKAKGIRDAMLYGLSIIIIYVGLGLIITGIFGANALNSLATNAIVNIFFCLLLVVFALSFFGWFELSLPSSWADKVDSKASNTGGLLGIFLMAFTLTLVSFSCTGPIIGFLLVDFATSGSIAAPAVGMLGFAIALALPFTLFALFPTWLKQAPKSGSWMNTLKVTLGFIELAFACKFFSVADLAYGWHLMDREVFLALWIVIFGCLGLYLLGMLRFPHDGDRQSMPVPCIMLGMASLAFTVYLVPGLWGAPCKAVSAFSPPMNTQDFNINPDREVTAQYTDYDEGMAAAKRLGKPVMLDFTGYGCVNCRKMEAAVWTDPEVADRLKNDFVLISLYVDDKRPLPEPIEVTRPDGTKRKLRTIGDRWSYLEETSYGYLSQPFYVVVNHEGKPLSGSFTYKEDVPEFLKFLEEGSRKFKQ